MKGLCQNLEFGDAYDRPEQDLKESTQNWRKQYINPDRTRGNDLTDWRSAKTQNDLNRMAEDYLRLGGYGLGYWPSGNHRHPKRTLEYPRDEKTYVSELKTRKIKTLSKIQDYGFIEPTLLAREREPSP